MHNIDFGNWGEKRAAEYLIKKGYKILSTNFNSYRGEIDIIAKDAKNLVFCEVKTRRNIEYGLPIEAVNYYKKKHLYAAAEYYLYKNGIRNVPVRFDVIEVLLINHKIKINHVKNIM